MPRAQKNQDQTFDRLRDHFAEVEAKRWGELVAARRRELHLSQGQLATVVGCPFQTISKVELGQIVPRDYLKAALALALAVEVDELFPWPSRREMAVAS